MEQHRAPGLDTLRGCAILSVLIFHYFNNTSLFRVPSLLWLQDLTSHTFLGVDLFFVLSGFLIGGSLMASRDNATYFSAYFARRIGRIFPLYYAWLAIFLLMMAVGAGRLGPAFQWLLVTDGIPIWSYFTFTQNFFAAQQQSWGAIWLVVTWSLAIEMQFYVLIAIAIYFTPVRYVGVLSLGVIAATVWFRRHGGYDDFSKLVITQTRIDMAFAGVFSAWLMRAASLREFVARNAITMRIVSVALIAFLNVNYVYGLGIALLPVRDTLIAFAFAVVAFSQGEGSASPATRFVRWCGVRCYGIYIFHMGILGIIGHIIFNWPANVFPPGVGWPAVLISLLITFGLAALSWRFFEKPILVMSAERFPIATPSRRQLATS